ncbi:hypothetical protein K505DRAFT_229653 [Melanomma pulvis-pyrius CBS 109.77]|uniref:Uncharacterized protein n=1 Tax=Melanomma pulvis-pyrius CBS 109.77 TaxID=1314802 RepID=A0A6A6XW72_9PLEO|nr:hypothetical protein K505DRAFT_229653 [Melanomma pulvis-pyrius CBS 109.77]
MLSLTPPHSQSSPQRVRTTRNGDLGGRLLRCAGLWPLVSKKKPRPTPPADADEWDNDDKKAIIMLLTSLHNNLTISAASCNNSADTATDAWVHLASRFDCNTSNTSIYMFRPLTNLRYYDEDDLWNHLEDFHQL